MSIATLKNLAAAVKRHPATLGGLSDLLSAIDALPDYDAERKELREKLSVEALAHKTWRGHAEKNAADRDRFKADYEGACKLVAQMHAATGGKFGDGPRVGVLEDVEVLRADRDIARAALEKAQADFANMNADSVRFALERSDALAAEAVMLRGPVTMLTDALLALPTGALSGQYADVWDAHQLSRAALATPSRAAEWLNQHDEMVIARFMGEELCEECEVTLARTDDEGEGLPKPWFCIPCWNAMAERCRRAGLDEAANKCEAEADAYAASVREMDAAGQTQIGTAETRAVLACRRCADAVRALADRAPETAPAKPRCGKKCDHGSPCRLAADHEPADSHHTEHSCIFYDTIAKPSEPCATCGGVTKVLGNGGFNACPDCCGSGVRR